MAYQPGRRPVYQEPYVERRGPVRRIVGAVFATALGLLAFLGLLVVAAIVLIVVLI